MKNNSEGMALVLVLLVVALVTAMVIEFASAVYTSTNALYNWSAAQRVSLIARSGIDLATKAIIENAADPESFPYTSEPLEVPFDKPFAESEASAIIRVVDENSKFNVNSLVYQNGTVNDIACESFKRLLKYLSIDTSIADHIADWMDADKEPRTAGSELHSKNAKLDSVDELLLIKRVEKTAYDRLAPYVTIYGDNMININSAEIPVLMTLENFVKKEPVTEAMAEGIINYRKARSFAATPDLQNVSGFKTIWQGISGMTVTGKSFFITSSATDKGITRTISCVIDAAGGILYWQEI